VRFDFYKNMASDETASGYRETRAVVELFRVAYDGLIDATFGAADSIELGWMAPTEMGESLIDPQDGEEFGTFSSFIAFDLTYALSIPYT